MIYRFGAHRPSLGTGAYVHESASVIGDVTLGDEASVWCGAVVRGDEAPIVVGAQSNIQDNCVLHADPGAPLQIGSRVTLGHLVMAHGCTIGDGSLLGIGCIVLNGAVIGEQCLVAAGALVPEGKQFPARSLILGSPARVVRTLDDADLQRLAHAWQHYVHQAQRFAQQLERIA